MTDKLRLRSCGTQEQQKSDEADADNHRNDDYFVSLAVVISVRQLRHVLGDQCHIWTVRCVVLVEKNRWRVPRFACLVLVFVVTPYGSGEI